MADQPLWLTFIVAFILMNVLLVGMAYMTWFERKVIAAFQDRLGPTRTGPHGLLQPLADGIKLLGKEDLIPGASDPYCPRDGVVSMDVLRACTIILGKTQMSGRCGSR